MNSSFRHRVLGLFLALAAALSAAEVVRVTPQDAAALLAANKAVLVDVREPAEWTETGVAAPAMLLPKSDFDGSQKLWKEFLAGAGGKQIIVYCRSGRRSAAVASALAEKGFSVANAGGFMDWKAAGLPTRPVEPAKP